MLAVKQKETKALATPRVTKGYSEGSLAAEHPVADAATTASDSSANEALQNKSWDEMIFQDRNRDYGAYVLRKGYATNVAVGIAITILVVSLILLGPFLSTWLGTNERADALPRKKLVYSELSVPPPIDKPRPLPPSVQLPKLKHVLKFVAPTVVKEEVTQQIATLEEIKSNDTGATEVDGPTEVVFEEPVADVVADDNELFTVVDQQPEFEGGYAAMMAFVKANMKYPANARRMRTEGTVHVSFIVSKTGAISEVQVLRGFMTECDREAVRVVNLMPAWKPGKQNGRNVNVRFILPLKFKLD